MMKPKVSRRAQRYQVHLEVKELNGHRVADTCLVDISTVGARLESSTLLKPKDHVAFSFHQPNEDSETRLAGVIVWVKPVEGQTGRYQMGVEFHRSFLVKSPATKAPPDIEAGGEANTSLVSFLGSKGGVGNTFLTVNVAYLLAREKLGKVLVVDLDLLYGQAIYFFDAKPKHTIVEVIENFDDLDSSYLQSLLHNCNDYLSLLPAPLRLEDAETVNPVQVRKILQYLKSLRTFKWILIDCPHHLGEVTLTALESSDDIFLTTVPSMPALYNAKKLLNLLDLIGQGQVKVSVILNSFQKHQSLTDAEIQKFLGHEVDQRIGFDPTNVDESIDVGKLLAATAPKVAASLGLNTIVDKLTGNDGNDNLPMTGRWGRWKDMIKKS
jgi:MinD-like ATPase involved in chromosome partitioning or flagellar assembly